MTNEVTLIGRMSSRLNSLTRAPCPLPSIARRTTGGLVALVIQVSLGGSKRVHRQPVAHMLSCGWQRAFS